MGVSLATCLRQGRMTQMPELADAYFVGACCCFRRIYSDFEMGNVALAKEAGTAKSYRICSQ